jgi:hypothetical protein
VSNQSSKSKASAATAASFVVFFVMAWSPFQRANAGIIGVEQPGDYANPIPTTSATGPLKMEAAQSKTARAQRRARWALVAVAAVIILASVLLGWAFWTLHELYLEYAALSPTAAHRHDPMG